MAITITQQPIKIYPAYNDCWIIFTSDLEDNNKAEITINPTTLFTNTLLLYPDSDGVYMFNLKEFLKSRFNQYSFNDATDYKDVNNFLIALNDLRFYIPQNITITVYSDESSETDTAEYEFYRGIKQVGEKQEIKKEQLLSYSKNRIDYNLTYFEGFPFFVDFLYLSAEDVLLFENKNNDSAASYTTNEESTHRFYIDRGKGDNATVLNELALMEGLNKIEYFLNDTFVANINIIKKRVCSGIYLKWFNRFGSYNFYLFERYAEENIESSESELIYNNEFNNIYDSTGDYISSGKEGTSTIIAKAYIKTEEIEIFKDLLNSPSVQMYTERERNLEGEFINVSVEGSMSLYNKKYKNEISITITMPNVATIQL